MHHQPIKLRAQFRRLSCCGLLALCLVTPLLQAGSRPLPVLADGLSSGATLDFQVPTPTTRFAFTHITADQGLSDNQVQPVLQDRAGFLWFGTYNGLTRYDGSDFVVYRNNPDLPGSLSGNFIYKLFEDKSGILWVATGDGLNAYDAKTNSFKSYRHDPANPASISGNSVRSVYEDKQGVLWVGTESAGLDRFDREKGTFTSYQHDPADPQSLAQNDVYALHEDRAGNFWVVTYGGVDLMDRAKGTFKHYQHDPADPQSLSSNNSWQFYEDHTGALWVGTWGGGLERLDPATGHFTHYTHDPNNPNSLGNDQVESLYEDASGALWVGTNEGGISILDPARKTFITTRNDPSDPTSLSNNRVAAIYGDRTGLIWVGTQGGGVNVYNPRQQIFSVRQHDPGNANSPASNSITTVFEDKEGALWLGTADAGLDRIDRKSGQVTHYPATPGDPRGLGYPYVAAVAEDPKGVLWLGTYGGLYKFDPATGVFTGYVHDPANPNTLSDNTIFGLRFDPSGILWIATDGGGLNRFDPATGMFTTYHHDGSKPGTLTGDNLLGVVVDDAGMVWASSLTGLNRLDPATGKVTRYLHDPAHPESLTSSVVWAIHEDRTGTLWVGTGDGVLHSFDPATGTFTHYRDADYLNPGPILTILEDRSGGSTERGNLWAVRADVPLSELARGSKTLNSFGIADGVPRAVFRQASGFVTGDGMVMIGSNNGLVAFDPTLMQTESDPAPVVFTDFQLANKSAAIGNGSPLATDINDTQSITLDYTDRVISFKFAVLDYRAPEASRYRYILEGFDTDWTEVDSKRRLITYTNLDPGQYTFRVTASNADGVWNETGRAINLVIAPPWYGTLWFRGLLLLLLVGGILAFYRWRISNLETRRRALERGIAQRTVDLAHANTSLQVEISERKQFEEALQQSNSDLAALNQIAQELTQWGDLPGTLHTVGGMISALFGKAAVGIWLLDLERTALVRLFAVDPVQGVDPEGQGVDPEGRAPEIVNNGSGPRAMVLLASDPVTNQVVESAETLVLAPGESGPPICTPENLPAGDSAGGVALVPLQSRGEVLGLVCIRATEPEYIFTPTSTALAQTLGGTLANAIENSRLFADAQAEAAEEERRRLARELHDSVSQALYAASLTADVLPDLWERDPNKGRQGLEIIQRFTRGAVAEMRLLLVELRPSALVQSSLDTLLETLCAATDARDSMVVEAHLVPMPILPPDVQVALYRIAQEGLNNILKHARAAHAVISLQATPAVAREDPSPTWHGEVILRVADDGRGFDTSHAPDGRLGLSTMRERAAGIGATLVLASQPGAGTDIEVKWTGSSQPTDAV